MYNVIVVDDSRIMRRILSKFIDALDNFRVIATACDAYEAREKIKRYEPDLVTLDINMPKMNGNVFLKNIMRLRPMPVIVISTEKYIQADVLKNGALGFVTKNYEGENSDEFFNQLKNMLTSSINFFDEYKKKRKVKNIKKVKNKIVIEPRYHPDVILPKKDKSLNALKVIAIGSSTGGVEALMQIFKQLPSGLPPIVITQHIPLDFSASFANRLNEESKISVMEASGGEELLESHAYLAPGNMHMVFQKQNGVYVTKLLDGVKVSRHKPSVDVMIRSVSNEFGNKAMGIILTGMGDDGTIGLKELKDNGGLTIAQSEKSCVVYGMPRKAYEAGGIVKNDVDLQDIAKEIIDFASK